MFPVIEIIAKIVVRALLLKKTDDQKDIPLSIIFGLFSSATYSG